MSPRLLSDRRSAQFPDVFATFIILITILCNFHSASLTQAAPVIQCQAPVISTQPVNQAVCIGSTAELSVSASGTAPLTFQWNYNGQAISGATSNTLRISPVTGNEFGFYYVTISNGCGTVTSATAILALAPPVQITTQPASQTVSSDESVILNAEASTLVGATLSIQWQLNIGNGAGFVNVIGATSRTLPVSRILPLQNGWQFRAVFRSGCNEVVSNSATLTVTPPDTDRDGIPDPVEITEGTSPGVRDNDIFSNNRLFAMQQYRDFLSREGEGTGINYWTSRLNGALPPQLNRTQVLESFFVSAEFQNATAPVARLYLAMLQRIPDFGNLIYYTNLYRSGQQSLGEIARSLSTSSEYRTLYSNLDDATFITRLYQNILGRTPAASEVNYWVGVLNGSLPPQPDRPQVLAQFADSPEYRQTSAQKILVIMSYVSLLRRSPEQEGFDAWMGFLAGGNSSLALFEQFLNAPEYRNRFQP